MNINTQIQMNLFASSFVIFDREHMIEQEDSFDRLEILDFLCFRKIMKPFS